MIAGAGNERLIRRAPNVCAGRSCAEPLNRRSNLVCGTRLGLGVRRHLVDTWLYVDPPDKAIVLAVHEKSQMRALDRTAAEYPRRRGTARRACDPRNMRACVTTCSTISSARIASAAWASTASTCIGRA